MLKPASGLWAAQQAAKHPDVYIMEVPVISTAHLPRTEADLLYEAAPELTRRREFSLPIPDVVAIMYPGDAGDLLLRLDPDERDEAGKFSYPDYPVLAALATAIAEKGFSFFRLSAECGDVYADLPQFDW